MGTQIIGLILLIIMNAFFAGSEIAFISLNHSKTKSLAEEGDRKARYILKLKEVPNRFLSTIQIGVSLASVLSGVFASEAFAAILTDWILSVSNFSPSAVKTVSMLIITLITSYLMLVFGELVPKRVAMNNPERFADIAIYPLWFLSKVTTPIVRFLSFSTNIVLRILGIDPNKVDEEVTEEEIRIMVDAGEIDLSEKEMINNIFEFDNKEVADIMTHRTEVVSIDAASSFEDILNLVNEERFTRYPVYEENMDNIIGVIHLRDLLRYIHIGNKTQFHIGEVLMEPYFVPESKRTDQMFKELQFNKIHMAIVVDEYGGTAGIVTMEDLIEEVMGNILDEFDDEEELYDIVEVEPGEYLAAGACELDELEDILGIDLPLEDYDTVSGFMIGQLGRIPTVKDINNEESCVEFGKFQFWILEIDEKVISRVRIVQIEKNEEEISED